MVLHALSVTPAGEEAGGLLRDEEPALAVPHAGEVSPALSEATSTLRAAERVVAAYLRHGPSKLTPEDVPQLVKAVLGAMRDQRPGQR